MTAAQELPDVGALLGGGKYRVVRLVGNGGMGAVYEAVNLDTTRRVAVKILRPELASRAHVARRFAQEARAACRIEHPNIVGVFDLIQEGATLFIVEEFLEGEDLKQHVIARGPMKPVEALRTVIPVMEALVWAHGRGVVHRDVKPDNIFLASSPRGTVPKVIDFGIARVLDDDGDSLQGTVVGEVMGTAYYMSPEQARGDVEVIDGRTDVWSIGAVLYFATSGARPFEAQNRNQLLYRITHDDATPLTERAPGVPAEFAALVHGALARDLDKRHASMEALLQAARACLGVLEERTELAVSLPPDEAGHRGDPEPELPPAATSAVQPVAEEVDPPTVPMATAQRVSPVPTVPLAEPPAQAVSTPPQPPVSTERKGLPESTPASWEMSDIAPKSSKRRVWVTVFAAAIALGAVVGLYARSDGHDARPATTRPARPPMLETHPLVPAIAPTVPETNTADASPVAIEVDAALMAIEDVAPAGPDDPAPAATTPAVEELPAVETAPRGRRGGDAGVRRPARPRILPLAPNPYEEATGSAIQTPRGMLRDPWAR